MASPTNNNTPANTSCISPECDRRISIAFDLLQITIVALVAIGVLYLLFQPYAPKTAL
ncbi:MAG: hypothetical protein K940chlam9_00370 [Chlamydiae bacterium]|nr:hypothetical protein [Chlamydiota bacterium]